MSRRQDLDHAFKGTRFPWTQQRMEFVLNELISRHKKYKAYTKLIDVYIILAEKIGATPRIVENFIKNLGRDYREWMKVNPNCDRDTMTLRGSNIIFKMFEEYNRIYTSEDSSNSYQNKLSEYTLDEQDSLVTIPDGKNEDDDSPQYVEIIDADLKEEPGLEEDNAAFQITSVTSISSPARSDNPPSPIPPPPPLPRVPKSQGRRSMVTMPVTEPSPVSALRQHESAGLQDIVAMQQDRDQIAQMTHMNPQSAGNVHTPSPVSNSAYASATNPGLLSTISSLPSLQHPQFHLPQGQTSSQGVGSSFIPLHLIQNGGIPPSVYTTQSSGSSIPSAEVRSTNPGTSNKRPLKTSHDTQPHSSKKSRSSNVPLVAENLPDGMSEFENRYLQALDTQNKMLSDIGRELKLLRTGFFAIHSDDIADMVNPNMH
nr:uncharacterized protein LOC129258872 [Lytechinus pictus]